MGRCVCLCSHVVICEIAVVRRRRWCRTRVGHRDFADTRVIRKLPRRGALGARTVCRCGRGPDGRTGSFAVTVARYRWRRWVVDGDRAASVRRCQPYKLRKRGHRLAEDRGWGWAGTADLVDAEDVKQEAGQRGHPPEVARAAQQLGLPGVIEDVFVPSFGSADRRSPENRPVQQVLAISRQSHRKRRKRDRNITDFINSLSAGGSTCAKH